MASQVIKVHAPACDDRGWVVRTQEWQSGDLVEQLHWYEEETAAEAAYHLFLRKCARAAA